MKLKVLTASLLLACSTLYAQTIEVSDAWVRTTVQGQKGTGAFMRITAKDGARLVGVSSPVAGVVEVHEMKMEGDIMKMRAVSVLELPAGQTVQLQPGGYHVMLMDLKQPLAKDSQVPLTLRFKDAKGTESQLELRVPVRAVAPSAGAGSTPAQAHGSVGHNGTGKH
jgi:copper(I)-binding protein